MHSRELADSLPRILGKIPTNESLIAVRLILCGVWAVELQGLRFEDFDGRIIKIRGKREREIVVDPTTSQLIRWLRKEKRWLRKEKRCRKGRIINLSRCRIAVILSEVLKECNIHVPYASWNLRETFIFLSIEKGRNIGSVYLQAGKKLPMNIRPPSIEERLKDFDSKPIL